MKARPPVAKGSSCRSRKSRRRSISPPRSAQSWSSGTHRRLREAARQEPGKPRWSFLDGPITANNPMGVHHAWGRTYKDAFQRYFAMTGQRTALPERLRLPGAVGRGRGREGTEAHSRSATSKTSCPATPSPASTSSCSCARSASTSSPACRRSSRSASATGWTGTAPTRTGPSRRTSGAVYFTMSEENNYTIWSFLKKCHDRGLVYRGYDAMPWCPRCGVGLSQMEMNEGYQHGRPPVGVRAFPAARAGPARTCSSGPRRPGR